MHTHETVVLLAGVLGLVEQEFARLVFGLEASSVLSPIFGTMVLASIGVGFVRGSQKRNGTSETNGVGRSRSRSGGD